MPAQLIFASVPSGRSPGRSGYCTAARSRSMSDRLVAEIERHSAHEPGLGEAFSFRLLRSGAETVAVITRYADAGPDYTGRASTLAHHLIFTASESRALPPPADIAARFTGWRDRWDEPAAWIDESPPSLAGTPASLPANTWKKVTGDAGHAASLVDDSGIAHAGEVPQPSPREALALFAESALLTADRGWSTPFSTRDNSHDPDAVWRCGPARAFTRGALGRRAVMARSGVLPGARPEISGKQPAKTRLAPLDDTCVGTRRKRIPVAYIIAAIATATIPVILFFTLSSPPVAEPDKTTPPPAPPAVDTPPAVRAAITLADTSDWFAFHTAVSALTPAERELTPVAERMAKLRRRLIPDTLAALSATLDATPEPLPPQACAEIKSRLSAMDGIAGALGISALGPEIAARRILVDAITLMESLEKLPPRSLWVTPTWTVTEETPLATTRTVIIAGAAPLSDLLNNAKPPVSAACAAYAGPGAETASAAPSFTLTAGDLDFAAGKILALRHAEWGRILELRAESDNRIRLTLRSPNNADKRLTDTSSPLSVSFRDASGDNVATLLLNPSATQSPLTAPATLLRRDANGISTPAWIDAALARMAMPSGGARTLLPHGFESSPRDYPRQPLPASVVAQALRTRIDKALRQGVDSATIARLREQLAGVADHPLEYGAPWTLGITPPGSTAVVPIIRFTP